LANGPLTIVNEYLQRVAAPMALRTDAELLARYAASGEEEAFAQLLRRHGPMVLGVCRRALGPTPDADDAFQATFIALSQQAGRITECVPGWLYRVAVRTSRRALRRLQRGTTGPEAIDRSDSLAAVEWGEIRRVLDDELNRLPAHLRTPLVLCYLEGLTRDEAAQQLGWSLRTLHRRLDEGRRRLRDRLTKRGLAPALLATVVLGSDLRSEVPTDLVRTTIQWTRGTTVPGAIRALMPRVSSTGGIAMKAFISALTAVAGLGIALSYRQPSEACPPRKVVAPTALAQAPVAKEEPADDPLAKKIREAQIKGIEYLKSAQKDEGGRWTWENSILANLQPGGVSALVTLALLESGVTVNDPVVVRALPYLRTLEPKHTYVVSLQTQVVCKVNQKNDAERIKRNVKWLEDSAVWKEDKLRGWSYAKGQGDRGDNSNTRYAVTALYAAQKAGFKVAKDDFWKSVQDYYVQSQNPAGGWAYTNDVPGLKGSHTMTGSALIGLSQVKDIRGKDAKDADTAIDAGFAWIAKEFLLSNEPHTFYNFDVIAALGRASERKDFGTKDKKIDWYRLGAEWLLKNQKPDGRWEIANALDQYPLISTSFALRFLASRPD
jgi:RNA polymerase sigma factor (sigma-70 family)